MSSDTESDGERVTPQGGILEGANPTVWDSKNPITLFVIQVGDQPPAVPRVAAADAS